MNAAAQVLVALVLTGGSGAEPPDPVSRGTGVIEEPAEAKGSNRRGVRAFADFERGFGVKSGDGARSVSLGFLGQFRHELAPSTHDFTLVMARPVLSASLWNGRVRAHLMPEFAGREPELLDATAFVRLDDAVVVQVGQFRPWVSRGYRIGLIWQALPDRGPVLEEFRLDRDVGVTVRGAPWHGRFEYYLGVMNGEGKNATSFDSKLLYTARVVAAPFGAVPYDQVPYMRDSRSGLRVAFGANAYTLEKRSSSGVGSSTDDRDAEGGGERETGVAGDLVVYGGRFSTLAEGFWRQRRSPRAGSRNSWGAYGQASVLMVRDRFDLALRVGALNREDERGVRMPIESGFNVYFVGEHAKLQLRYGVDLDPPTGAWMGHAVTTQFQLVL